MVFPFDTFAPQSEAPQSDACESSSDGEQKPRRTSKKRMAIVEAARKLFCEEGYPGTSMDAIAAEAAVSKATVYAHFPSKQQLFSEVLSDVTDAYIRLSKEVYDAPLEEGMTLIAERFIEMITRPSSLTIFRTVMTQGEKFPEMLEAFRAAGPRRVIAAVADYFRSQSDRGRLSVPDPGLAAILFLHAVKGEAHARALATCFTTYSDSQVIGEIVRVVIKAYAPEPKGDPSET
jgi:AcrR family transcriptional regulator